VETELAQVPSNGLFLFWFIGHGTLSPGAADLHLLLPSSQDRGLEWSRVVRLFNEYSRVRKVAVLDCCRAGVVTNEDTLIKPRLTYLFPVAGKNETAAAEDQFDPDVGGKARNFSRAVCDWLLDGDAALGQVASFKDVFERVRHLTSYERTGVSHDAGGVGDDQFALNIEKNEAMKGAVMLVRRLLAGPAPADDVVVGS
jgi:hypothetical protein